TTIGRFVNRSQLADPEQGEFGYESLEPTSRMPEVEQISKDFTRVNIGSYTIWFSYKTPIAFQTPEGGKVVRENEWGPTTGKHLNYIDRGEKGSRVDGTTFEQQWQELAAAFAPAVTEEEKYIAPEPAANVASLLQRAGNLPEVTAIDRLILRSFAASA
ncbi:unnamed protein product, partial [marine sediment metagenome]